PTRRTSVPFLREAVMESKTQSTALVASFFDSPVSEETTAMRSFLLTLLPPLFCLNGKTRAHDGIHQDVRVYGANLAAVSRTGASLQGFWRSSGPHRQPRRVSRGCL